MSTQTIRPLTSINATQLRDDIEQLLTDNGFTLADLARLERQKDYRKRYNQRPDVKANRAAYMKQRYERQRQLNSLLKGGN